MITAPPKEPSPSGRSCLCVLPVFLSTSRPTTRSTALRLFPAVFRCNPGPFDTDTDTDPDSEFDSGFAFTARSLRPCGKLSYCDTLFPPGRDGLAPPAEAPTH